MSPEFAFYLAWFLFFASWAGAALWTSETAARPGFLRELPYRAATLIGFILLFEIYDPPYFPVRPLYRMADGWQWLLLVFAFLGFGFCWWARIHLGPLWSGWITKKNEHHVIDTGPYKLVRHPIYTGLIVAAVVTAIDTGTLTAIAGAVIIIVGYAFKARLEEQFLTKELGEDAYGVYRRSVPMLVPFLNKLV
jgi:protein-S-isoprenylcysteine O-methyltransferase Ste14